MTTHRNRIELNDGLNPNVSVVMVIQSQEDGLNFGKLIRARGNLEAGWSEQPLSLTAGGLTFAGTAKDDHTEVLELVRK